MRKILLSGVIAFGLIATDPALCAQPTPMLPDSSQPVPGQAENPTTLPDPSTPVPPIVEPLPPEMPVVIDRSLPAGPPATNPAVGADSAVSGSTTSEQMTPVAATKTYPLCSRTLQDNCVNPGEALRNSRKRR